MNFEFSDEQELLREQARSFLADKCQPGVVRAVLESDAGWDANLWQQIAELGWTATTIPEAHGGLGLSHLELVVIAEELGRANAPVPFSSSVYLATEALLLGDDATLNEAWLPRLAAGEVIGTLAVAEGHGGVDAASISATVDGGNLTGTKLAVPDARWANFAVVAATEGGSVGLYVVDLGGTGVNIEAVQTLDPTRGHANITFDGAARHETDGDGWATLEKVWDRAAILFAWEQVGGAEAALDMAKEYAMGRYAFGRPIAGYQAIKHKLAHAYVKNTLARSNCYWGVASLAGDSPELPVAARGIAGRRNTQAFYYAAKENIQTHGGMGFTWEFDCQFYYRRSKLLSVNIGSEAAWKEKLISRVEAQNDLAAATP